MLDQFGFPGYLTRFAGTAFDGPSSCGSGSTLAHEGTVIVASNGNYSGVHFYTDFTLNSGVTMTVPAGGRRLVLIASGTITINGTITASGAGGAGGAIAGGGVSGLGGSGTDQPGGGGGSDGVSNGGEGGAVLFHGHTIQTGGSAGLGSGSSATQVTGSTLVGILMDVVNAMGGAGGGGSVGIAGGAGGGSIVLIAPTIVLASTATLNTSGVTTNHATYGGGGGGAGNIYIVARSYTDNGATFTQSGGGVDTGTISSGGAGAAGIKQILIFSDQVVRG